MMQTEQIKGSPPYSIGKVAAYTGLTTHVIRVWERRYSAIEPQRTEGKSRRYSEHEIRRLVLFKKLTHKGHAIGGIANLPTETLAQLAGEKNLSEVSAPTFNPTNKLETPHFYVDQFLQAIHKLDVTTAEQLLMNAALCMPPIELLQNVIQPTLWKVGQLWQDGTFRPSHEHAASASMRSLLGSLLRTHRDPQINRTVALGTLQGDLHEFGALIAALRAAIRGWNVLYLGPNLPPEEIAYAAHEGKASLVVISAVYGRKKKIRELAQVLRQTLHPTISLVMGGSGINPRKPIENISLLSSIEGIDDHLVLR